MWLLEVICISDDRVRLSLPALAGCPHRDAVPRDAVRGDACHRRVGLPMGGKHDGATNARSRGGVCFFLCGASKMLLFHDDPASGYHRAEFWRDVTFIQRGTLFDETGPPYRSLFFFGSVAVFRAGFSGLPHVWHR